MISKNKRNILYTIIIVLLLFGLGAILASRKREDKTIVQPEPQETGIVHLLIPEEKEAEVPAIDRKLMISEIMPKNRATICDASGNYPDYFEVENISEDNVNLSGWKISDERNENGWAFPDISIVPGGCLLAFADGKNESGEEIHTNFSISSGETLFLYDPEGNLVDYLTSSAQQADTATIKSTDGTIADTLYPSPGYTNSIEGYLEWQKTLVYTGPVIVSEVMVANHSTLNYHNEYPDWIEVKNISSAAVKLSDYTLSDSSDYLDKWRFPDIQLEAGECFVVLCSSEIEKLNVFIDEKYGKAPFSLNSQEDQVYISSSGKIIDAVALKDIPYECSMGRMADEPGVFYFAVPTPGKENGLGKRYVSFAPRSTLEEGIYNNAAALEIELEGEGDIYYTTDGSVPDQSSRLYTEPIIVTETTIIRAVSVRQDAMISRPASFTYFMNENCELPVVSLIIDDYDAYKKACKMLDKTADLPGNISLFEEGGSFNIGCTVKITGQASLEEYLKKGMRVKFSGAFGNDRLVYDLFGEGEKEYGMLSLRTGNDIGKAYIRNELFQSLAYDFTDRVISQHGKYCVVFINGEYYGIFCLKEKINEQYIADCEGVSKESIETETLDRLRDYTTMIPLYNDLYSYVLYSDMNNSEYYAHVEEMIDIDNFIDWYVLQGYSGNWDIIYRNVTFYRSSEQDNRWRLVFYDLDHSLKYDYYAFNNTYRLNFQVSPMAQLLSGLLKNDEFRDKYLKRAAVAMTTVFTNENVLKRIDELEQQILPEVERDCDRWGRTMRDYDYRMNELRSIIESRRSDYAKTGIKNICDYFNMTEEEFLAYADK